MTENHANQHMTENHTNQQKIQNNQNNELASEQKSIPGVEEVNEDDLDAVSGGRPGCPSATGYHGWWDSSPTPM
ncbi:hypothetical protein WA1_19985 [Scytonema hofmannii PCC 7110]|uniref:Uncharacterized protein n=1 Tax=Scytonema hofmannii PCC 7110 TaxID=128403 RepID=A0A139XC40_9CYAN|nr:hypothetical protein [Scytonema hofmannii]KYC42261.1 hypothetical protein WA1_19985 [Scytonema hofmannii PCC 7110]